MRLRHWGKLFGKETEIQLDQELRSTDFDTKGKSNPGIKTENEEDAHNRTGNSATRCKGLDLLRTSEKHLRSFSQPPDPKRPGFQLPTYALRQTDFTFRYPPPAGADQPPIMGEKFTHITPDPVHEDIRGRGRGRTLTPSEGSPELQLEDNGGTRDDQHGQPSACAALPGATLMLDRLQSFLNEAQPAIPTRSIKEDLIRFKWALICYTLFAIQSSYVPHLLSTALWIVWLPLFVTELRGWRLTTPDSTA